MTYKESFNVELKQEITADFKKEIIAFANTDGGEIFVGVNKVGEVVGVDNAEKLMEQIGNMIRDGIKPDLTSYTTIETLDDSGKEIVRVTVLRGVKRPYHLTDKGLKPSGVYLRHGVSSVPATDEAIRQMLKESDGFAFDKARCVNQELTFGYADKYFADNDIKFSDGNKRTLGLIDSDGYYTNAALLLSDQGEHNIKCAVYEGTGKMAFKARKEFSGSILKQMDDAYEYVSLNNNQNSTFDGLKRIEHPDYPDYAIRESLLNAIIHRDYDYSGSILINIFSDRIEFVSLGGLVKGITMKDIMGGISQPRNTVIANVFYRLRLIESYGTGVQRIIECYQGQAAQPIFAPAPASFVVTLPNTSDSGDASLSKDEKVLKLLESRGTISRKDVEECLSCSKFTAINVIADLLEKGIIVKSGAGPSVRYSIAK
jgi:ATP-dependent DNA helicase RecG